MAVVNQYKFVGIDDSTTGSALTPLGVGVPADVTNIDLIKYVSLTKGLPDPNGVNAAPLVLLSMPTNLYWFTVAINLKRNF